MGFFKERHGTVETLAPGRHFVWRIPNFLGVSNLVFDSPHASSFTNVSFHFHLVRGPQGDVSFYVHYKRAPIPKYSYVFTSVTGADLRQQTAHRIPQGTERCGHWKVCSVSDLARIMPPQDTTLVILFAFDDDSVAMQSVPGGESRSLWTIPTVNSKRLTPFSSPCFDINGRALTFRVEAKGEGNKMKGEGDYIVFLFARSGNVPPHTLAVMDDSGRVLASSDANDAPRGTHVLRFPAQWLLECCGASGSLGVSATFPKYNPLDFLNDQSSNAAGMPDRLSLGGPRMVEVPASNGGRGEQYVALNEDDV